MPEETKPIIRPLAERLAAQSRQQDEPMVCNACGSTFFFMVHVHQYGKPTGYLSTDSRTLTITPIPMRVCMCGNIVPPAASTSIGAPSERQAFHASLELARKRLDSADPNQLVKSLASVQELESLHKDILSLQARVDAWQLAETAPAVSPAIETPAISDEKLEELVKIPHTAPNPTGKKKQPKPKE